jgi:hypothetical protein
MEFKAAAPYMHLKLSVTAALDGGDFAAEMKKIAIRTVECDRRRPLVQPGRAT